ncbi:NAD(P)-dependent alcohol dehydrogenase [Crocosphaera sp. UHCC 0190]|uniref:NAD(P)-dependent alcohol dehydrogenase n=1 Tax=Crocosphaera sp. UHCC 0190 TaxID=3110246 RepID=UPI002B1F3A11|nr:NAD(P)-dependent alcohol dehydrogenase [Crocosphaera sp. UHCC 0190]MEA5511220.1 NAD(P)-dependent alcohol dehydrogenase [Crocosphaera sp. UHCC 0190]
MKAVIFHQYGSPDVLQYTEVAKPSPTPEQLLIKVFASSINPIDWKIRRGMLRVVTGNKFPFFLGSDFSGEVLEVGKNLTNFNTGDQVYGFVKPNFGGAYSEYLVTTPQFISPKPNNLNYLQAAAVPLAASTALQALRDQANIKNGQKVLINGASGGVGTFAVQIAKAYQTEVTAVCSSKNIPLVQQLGADHVIDYTQEDFTKNGQQYDIIFDAVSNRSFSACKNSLTSQGIYITLLPSSQLIIDNVLAFFSSKQVKFLLAETKPQDLAELTRLIEQGQITPIIDRTYNLSEIIAAHTYSEEGHAVGKIVIEV